MKQAANILALALGVSAWSAMAQDAGGQAPGAPPARPGFHLLPPWAMEQLNLTDDQKKQLAELQAEVKAKIEKILTPEQMQQLNQLRPPMGPGMGRRGFGGPPPAGGGQPQPPAQQQ